MMKQSILYFYIRKLSTFLSQGHQWKEQFIMPLTLVFGRLAHTCLSVTSAIRVPHTMCSIESIGKNVAFKDEGKGS